MKASCILTCTLMAITLAKNVAVLPELDDDILKAVNLEAQLGKREAKNVVDLLEPREAKNTVKIAAIDTLDILDRKRDAKNIADLNLVVNDASLEKREGKNVVNLNLEAELSSKREAKNVVNLSLFVDESAGLAKRGSCHMRVHMKNVELSDDEIENIDDLNVIIDGESYEVSKQESSTNEDFELSLKPWTAFDKVTKYVLDLSPLTDLMENLQLKAHNYLSSNSLDGHTELYEPLKGDLASALTINDETRLFSSYLRQISDIYSKCEINEGEVTIQKEDKQLLILAPTNQALFELTQKPWEFPQSTDEASTEAERDSILLSNIRHFVESHIIEAENFDFVKSNDKMVHLHTINSESIYLKNDGGKGFWIHTNNDQDSWILVSTIQVVENGALLTIPQTLTHP